MPPHRLVATLASVLPPTEYREKESDERSKDYLEQQHGRFIRTRWLDPEVPTPQEAVAFCYYMRSQGVDSYARLDPGENRVKLFLANRAVTHRDDDELYWDQCLETHCFRDFMAEIMERDDDVDRSDEFSDLGWGAPPHPPPGFENQSHPLPMFPFPPPSPPPFPPPTLMNPFASMPDLNDNIFARAARIAAESAAATQPPPPPPPAAPGNLFPALTLEERVRDLDAIIEQDRLANPEDHDWDMDDYDGPERAVTGVSERSLDELFEGEEASFEDEQHEEDEGDFERTMNEAFEFERSIDELFEGDDDDEMEDCELEEEAYRWRHGPAQP